MAAISSSLRPAAGFRPVTAARMRALDRRAERAFGMPGLLLMENAGRAAADAAALFPGRRVAVLCGPGNNGGDGLVAARHLAARGLRARLALARPPSRYEGDAAAHWRMARRAGVPYIVFQRAEKLLRFLRSADFVVDALLGTGSRPPLREPYASLVRAVNASRRPTLAVDIPSGLDADGGPFGEAVRARVTVAMALPKPGLLRPAARPFVGRLLVADIGFPKALIAPYRR